MIKILLLAATCAIAAFGSTAYTYTVPSSTASVTITQSEHGFSSTRLAVDVHDQNGVKLGSSNYSYFIDSSNYSVSISVPNSLGAGSTVQLIGPFAGSDTAAASDFRLEVGIWNNLLVCGYCTSNAFAQRSYSSNVYVMETASAFGLTSDPG